MNNKWFDGRWRSVLFSVMACIFVFAGQVRAEEPAPEKKERPKIGLVLGGGGALGFAHIGVLKVLEEAQVPIDYIAGTSMGSIIGGLYASGMSPDEIQTLLQSLNWDEVMSDKTPRRELFFRRKLEDQRYLFEMGMGLSGRPIMGMGMAAGQKLNNVIQFMTLRTSSITNFNELPIPFRAVATDLESGLPYVIDHGNLARAMRASMAVPGAFTPALIEGHLLVDGGVVNNLPVDVVKAMGADIIIAVDVGSGGDTVTVKELKSLGAILGRTYSIAQRPSQIENFKKADIGIQPPLLGFSASQFNRIGDIAPEGEEAAREKLDQLKKLGVGKVEYEAFLARQRVQHPARLPITRIKVVGNNRVSEANILGRINTKPGDDFNPKKVNLDLMRIYGIGEFEQVLFRIEKEPDGGNTLVYDTKEKDWGPTYFKYGLRLSSDMQQDAQWGMLLNLTHMSLNPLGGEWRNEVEIGSMQNFVSEFYQPLDPRGFFFVAPSFEFRSDMEGVYEGDDRVAEYEVSWLAVRVDAGVQINDFAELRVGPYRGQGDAEVTTGDPTLPEVDEDLAGWETTLVVDRQDRTIFARQGSYFRAEGRFADEALGGEREYDRVELMYRGQHSIKNHTASLGLRYGTSLDSDLPTYDQFTLGGPFGFAGLAEDQFRGVALSVASLGYRYRLMALPSALGRGVYAMSRYDYGNTWEDEADRDFSDGRSGVLVGFGIDAAIGPMLIAYGMSEGGYDRWYLTLGTIF